MSEDLELSETDATGAGVSFFHVGFHIDDFWPAFLGALIVSIVSVVLNALVKEETE